MVPPREQQRRWWRRPLWWSRGQGEWHTGYPTDARPRYVYQSLKADERVVYATRLHWVVFTPAIVAAVAGVLWPVLAGVEALFYGALLVLVAAPLLARPAWIAVTTSEFAVTNTRVMITVGPIRERTLELPFAEVENVSVDHSILGRMLGYGTVTITADGGSPKLFNYIRAPFTYREHIQEQVAAAKESASGAVASGESAAVPSADEGGKDRRRAERRSGMDRRARAMGR